MLSLGFERSSFFHNGIWRIPTLEDGSGYDSRMVGSFFTVARSSHYSLVKGFKKDSARVFSGTFRRESRGGMWAPELKLQAHLGR